jgi:hypothetical protein
MNNQARKIAKIVEPRSVMEGAGVRLIRSIATSEGIPHASPPGN